MAKLKRLKINKFRNVEPVELHFSDGFNVLLGINGSGKTTFLELIAALLRWDVSTIIDEEFFIEYAIDLGDVVFEAQIENSAGIRKPIGVGSISKARARAKTHGLIAEIRFRLRSEPEDEWTELDLNEEDSSFFPVLDLCELRPETFRAAEALQCITRFDESIDFFRSLHKTNADAFSNITTLGDRSAPEVGLELREPHERVSKSLMRAMSDRSKGEWPTWREPLSLRFTMKELPFLAEFVRLAGLEDGWLEIRLLRTERGDIDLIWGQEFGDLEFWFERQDGSRVRGDKLSHGQKRLLSFLYYLDCNPHIVIADELTNGLHHAWITACLESIGDRQAFLANQDPLLVDDLEFASPEDVKRAFILCRCDTSSGKERLVWSHMSDDDAERFFEAYEVGLQHVSEILRTKNLW